MYSQHQRGEYEQQEEVKIQIAQLREKQKRITGQSQLAIKYVSQILKLGKSRYQIEMRNEQLRIYHKWLSFILR